MTSQAAFADQGLNLLELAHVRTHKGPIHTSEALDSQLSYIEETRAQERPAERARYADSGSLRWQAARRIEKWRESYRKRRAFEALVRRG